jgi:hypothetical protein
MKKSKKKPFAQRCLRKGLFFGHRVRGGTCTAPFNPDIS